MSRRLALGTVQFGLPYGVANKCGQVSREEAARILNYAAKVGLDTLDTAMAYGQSEQRLGEIGVKQWHIISKLPAIPGPCQDISGWVEKSVSESLNRLGVSRLSGLLLHRPQELLGQDGHVLYSALQSLKQDGIVEKIGISIYDPKELDVLIPRYLFDIVQAPFNVMDRRLITSNWLARLKQEGTEVHVRSVFLQGLLLMDASNRPPRFQKWQKWWDIWHEWLTENRLSPLQASLSFALAQTEIDRVIVGVDTVRQLQGILASTDVFAPIPPIDLNCEDPDLINPSRWNL
jgi:aryl-alcohol dehydrogenase-like predicted oxidoreductase